MKAAGLARTPAWALCATALLALAGCTVGPDWQRPKADTPELWRIQFDQAAEVANVRWWEAYGDPALTQVVDTALIENRDLIQAAARVDQFLGALRTTRSQFYPQFDYGASASRNRASENGVPPLTPGADRNYSLYEAALGASWQIDLFGRVRRQAESAQAQVYASEQGRRGIVLSVVSGVATGYVTLRALDRQLEIARRTAENYAGTLRVFEQRHKGGAVSEVERSQVESQYQQALAAIPELERQVAQQENLVSVLIGRNPGDIQRGKSIEELLEPAIPASLPADLLERRPDILQAEQNLRAANAEIGVAKSLYFPTLSLTGLLGFSSSSLSDFVKSSSSVGSLAAGLTGPIFTFGGIEGQVQTAQAAEREALAFYQQVVLNAFRETNDALVGYRKGSEAYTARSKRTQSLRTYARLSRARYEGGSSGYLEVLYAENELFAAELSAVDALLLRNAELINVYKALGGGWVDVADPLAPKQAAAPTPAAAGAAAAPVPAAAPPVAGPSPPVEDRVTATREGQALVIEVQRMAGSGGARIEAPASGWPASVEVRLRGFSALPELRIDAAGSTLECRPSGTTASSQYPCAMGGNKVEASNIGGNDVRVQLPPKLLGASVRSFDLRWSERVAGKANP